MLTMADVIRYFRLLIFSKISTMKHELLHSNKTKRFIRDICMYPVAPLPPAITILGPRVLIRYWGLLPNFRGWYSQHYILKNINWEHNFAYFDVFEQGSHAVREKTQ